jgi:hypothetical protein
VSSTLVKISGGKTLKSMSFILMLETRDIIPCGLSRYKPSRWLNLPEEYNPNYSFLSFLAGPRACIGKTMAIMEIKAVIAWVVSSIRTKLALMTRRPLIANFSFEPAYEGQVINSGTAITMSMCRRLNFIVANRNPSFG